MNPCMKSMVFKHREGVYAILRIISSRPLAFVKTHKQEPNEQSLKMHTQNNKYMYKNLRSTELKTHHQ